ncbi:enoyl-CoA hydratase/carnithine racemase [Actinocorallia herbida]|uniref:Enoyl-CoA hydratase/carnithine racemase n=1 Tax=Actinocorallia herbida TaxID=58109 RepID=A0A3N1D1S9_9ACTN|nr:enoyl-CoA hydratase/isomerase family protein [Actinocorallia herbida]ROO87497.1 enoyl-CoA hydratase/carnithine racemase [Actinocorallia herbida]
MSDNGATAVNGPEAGPRLPEGDWLGTPHLRFERHGAFARVVVDRPEARNALTPAMYFGIRYAVRVVDADPDLAGLLITGVDDVFIPGGDLGKKAGDNWLHLGGVPGAIDVVPFDVLRQSVKPVVSAVNGICQGGGLMIALCSDLAVVSDRATFRVPELLRGISDTYYAQVLVRLLGPVRTRDLMLTARTLTAEEALDWGLVSRVVPHDELMASATEILAECCKTAPLARRDIKRVLDQYVGLHDRVAMFDSLQRPESREGFAAFIEKRSPDWVHADLAAAQPKK